MLVRIVKMSFKPDAVELFLEHFNANKSAIRHFEGCQFLELYQDEQCTNIFFTYSYWASDTHLEHYRSSEVFRNVWAKTKPLFNAKPEAWSVKKIVSLS